MRGAARTRPAGRGRRARRRRAFERWAGRRNVAFAWVVLAVAVLHPAHGTGLPLCWLRATTGIPCPGCGLTRSASCAARGMLDASLAYHPFGVALVAGAALLAASSLLPRRWRRRAAIAVMRRARAAGIVYAVAIGAFLAWGAARAVGMG